MNNFNLYLLNANFTTEDGVNLIDPTFKVVQLEYNDEIGESTLYIHWKDAKNEINRAFETPIVGYSFPTVEFLEGQLLQIPEFKASTIVEP